MQDLTFESLAKDIKDVKVLVASFTAQHEDEDKKKLEAKKAQDDKQEEEKKEAKTAAMKKAMDEKDEDKRDAAMKKAMDMDDKEHKEATSDEDKEKEAQVASIIADKKQEFIQKILTANSIANPNNLKEIETRLKSASINEVKKEWSILAPMFEGAVKQQPTQQKFVPFYANIDSIDDSQLNASSPDSDFNKISTKDLLEMYQ